MYFGSASSIWISAFFLFQVQPPVKISQQFWHNFQHELKKLHRNSEFKCAHENWEVFNVSGNFCNLRRHWNLIVFLISAYRIKGLVAVGGGREAYFLEIFSLCYMHVFFQIF